MGKRDLYSGTDPGDRRNPDVPGIDGKKRKRRPITYVADFVYYRDDEKVIEDVKGLRTPVYNIKKKLFEYRYHETIREV